MRALAVCSCMPLWLRKGSNGVKGRAIRKPSSTWSGVNLDRVVPRVELTSLWKCVLPTVIQEKSIWPKDVPSPGQKGNMDPFVTSLPVVERLDKTSCGTKPPTLPHSGSIFLSRPFILRLEGLDRSAELCQSKESVI